MSSSALVIKVAQPYAEALIDSAKSKGLIDEITNDMNIISQLLTSSADLKKFLGNPLAKPDSKKKVLNDILADQVSPTTFSFLMILVDRGRIDVLETVVERYLELAYKLASVEVAQVVSALPLSANQQELLIQKLQKITGAGEVKLKLSIDVSLLGGFIVKVGTQVIDASLLGQLKQISTYLGTSLSD
jgi:F-type H+-transporting ATPase subunit delta